jgi:hypothetical protein
LKRRKKILSILIKIAIGVASVLIIYFRLQDDFTSENSELLKNSLVSSSGLWSLIICVLLIPVNWGIETYKWQLITKPIEKISFKRASQSVYSGICLGNLAPARATEFIAKIIFFKPENRPKITVLHFFNGMFQLSVTYVIGFVALVYRLHSFGENVWMAYTAVSSAITIILVFMISIWKIDKILKFISDRISKDKKTVRLEYKFEKSTLFQLFGFSFVRYGVFFVQMLLMMNVFSNGFSFEVALGIALYFLITTSIPMISFLEAAIRTAVALIVFKNTGISSTALALASLAVWLINIIIPSIAGYIILVRQNFDFKFSAKAK